MPLRLDPARRELLRAHTVLTRPMRLKSSRRGCLCLLSALCCLQYVPLLRRSFQLYEELERETKQVTAHHTNMATVPLLSGAPAFTLSARQTHLPASVHGRALHVEWFQCWCCCSVCMCVVFLFAPAEAVPPDWGAQHRSTRLPGGWQSVYSNCQLPVTAAAAPSNGAAAPAAVVKYVCLHMTIVGCASAGRARYSRGATTSA
jgi:hypothetical protein